MKNKRFFFTLIVSILLTSLSFAQIPSPLKDVKVSATATLDTTTGIYTYNYSIYNPPINDGQIWSFDIDISKPSGTQELGSKGLIIQKGMRPDGTMFTRSFEEEIARRLMRKPVIPVGTQFHGWSSGITVIGTVGWGSSEKTRIMPGNTLHGFIIISRGLPGIRDAMLQPDIDYDNLPEEYWENVELTRQLRESLIYRTKAIGPTAPPADFKPIPFLDYIISLKHEAYNLGWIKNKGIENSLDAKLDNAKKKIEQGNIEAAKYILNAFINEVEAQGCATYEDCSSDKHISPEAYSLLKYNVQYLIGKL